MSEKSGDLEALFAEARVALSPTVADRERNFALLAGASAGATGAAEVARAAVTATATSKSAAAGASVAGASAAGAATTLEATTAATSATATAGKGVGAWALLKGAAVAKVVVPLAVAGAVVAPLVRERPSDAPASASTATIAPRSAVETHEAAAGPSFAPPAPTGADDRELGAEGRSVPAPAPAPRALVVRPRATERPERPVGDAALLADEARLIERMARADRAASDEEVLRLAREHEARFGEGVLSEERRALETMARCRRGGDRPALVAAFRARHPRSPAIARVTDSCSKEK